MSENPLESALEVSVGRRVPGLSAALVTEDGVVLSGAAGLADLATRAPARPDTVYLWFSMTKIVTATAVMQLAERGALDLDAEVASLVPEFPGGPTVSPCTFAAATRRSSRPRASGRCSRSLR